MLDMLGIAVPRHIAADFYGCFVGAGIKLAAVEPEFIGLWYLLERDGHSVLKNAEYTAVAYVNMVGACLVVLRHKAIAFCRYIYPEAGRELIGDVTSGTYTGTDLLREISGALQYFSAGAEGGDINTVYLCGAVDGYFSDSCSFVSGSFNFCLLETELGFGEAVPPGLVVAAGLALRGLRG
jgi:hypothetical protein